MLDKGYWDLSNKHMKNVVIEDEDEIEEVLDLKPIGEQEGNILGKYNGKVICTDFTLTVTGELYAYNGSASIQLSLYVDERTEPVETKDLSVGNDFVYCAYQYIQSELFIINCNNMR